MQHTSCGTIENRACLTPLYRLGLPLCLGLQIASVACSRSESKVHTVQVCLAMQELWQPIANRLQPLLSLRTESQLRLFASARVPDPQPAPVASAKASASSAPAIDSSATDAGNNSGSANGADTTSSDVANRTHTLLSKADLPFFVDLDAWSLGFGRTGSGHVHPLSPDPHLIPETVLNFVAYVPARWRRPMTIAGSPPGEGFITPGWGGVAILNDLHASADDAAGALPAAASAAFHGLALQQLRQLLGLPDRWPVAAQLHTNANPAAFRREHGAASAASAASDAGSLSAPVVLLPPGAAAVALWEVDALLRHRFRQLMRDTADAVVTLLDLVQLHSFIHNKVHAVMRSSACQSEYV